eukprot:6211147-Pleurochrysis_carterae.AAC.2
MGHYAAIAQNNADSANHHPFPGHESIMPGFDPKNLAHQQLHVVKRAAGFDPDYQITAPKV